MYKDILLIFGAAFGRLAAINAAKAMGLKPLAVNWDANAAGMATPEIAIPVDIIDVEGVIAVARAHNVRGAITMQSDI